MIPPLPLMEPCNPRITDVGMTSAGDRNQFMPDDSMPEVLSSKSRVLPNSSLHAGNCAHVF